MIVMGVDPSLQHCGYTIWDTETFELLHQNACNNPSGSSQKGISPYVKIKEATKALIGQFKVEKVYVERMFQSRNPAITVCLFNALFCVQLAAHEMNVPCTTIAIMGKNSGWKHFILGDVYSKFKGTEGKQATRGKLQSDLGVKFQSEHIADSAGIALAGWYLEIGTDYRAVLGKEIPDGVGVKADKPPKTGGTGINGIVKQKREAKRAAKPAKRATKRPKKDCA